MNRKGFTLVELLATIVILGIVIGLTVVVSNKVFKNAKEKTEGVFVGTLEDALDIYVDSDARELKFDTDDFCTLHKTHGDRKVYKAVDQGITFEDVIKSSYSPITASELVNPANKGSDDPDHPYECKTEGTLEIYRDEDYVYYYRISKASFECLNNDLDGFITNLPECN